VIGVREEGAVEAGTIAESRRSSWRVMWRVECSRLGYYDRLNEQVHEVLTGNVASKMDLDLGGFNSSVSEQLCADRLGN